MPTESAMLASDLRTLAASGADGRKKVRRIARTIQAWGGTVTGSAPYWWARKYEVDALTQRLLFYQDELPLAFFSGSFAEYHWPELHRVLHRAIPSLTLSINLLVARTQS